MKEEGREDCASYPSSKSRGASTQLCDPVLSHLQRDPPGTPAQIHTARVPRQLQCLKFPPSPDAPEDPQPNHGEQELQEHGGQTSKIFPASDATVSTFFSKHFSLLTKYIYTHTQNHKYSSCIIFAWYFKYNSY